jgi:hypothetical protein
MAIILKRSFVQEHESVCFVPDNVASDWGDAVEE